MMTDYQRIAAMRECQRQDEERAAARRRRDAARAALLEEYDYQARLELAHVLAALLGCRTTG